MYSSIKHTAKAFDFKVKHLQMLLMLFFIFNASNTVFAQYVHPNQAGRKGGDTGVGIGNQVVTSTNFGTAGTLTAQGVVFSVNKDGTNKTAFKEFLGGPSDGGFPFYTTPFQASDGNLYGNTYLGGTNLFGAAYKITPTSCGVSIIRNNAAGGSGGGNFANMNELSDGKLYALDTYGGTNLVGQLVSMNKDGSGLTVLHTFSISGTVTYSAAATAQQGLIIASSKTDGTYPYGFVVEGADGKIYGTTSLGGAGAIGTVFRCNKDGSSYEIINIGDSNLRSTYKNGTGATISGLITSINSSYGNVAQGTDGKIYITGVVGGANGSGGVARMDADGANYQILHSGSITDGSTPFRGLIVIDSKIYGTYRLGGASTGGVVFSMNYDGTSYTKLKSFDGLGADGVNPYSSLAYDGTYLFGTTNIGGGLGKWGTIFKIKPDGTGFQTIHAFSNTAGATCNGKPGLYSYQPSQERVTFANVQIACALTCTENLSCAAGTAAPTFATTTYTNTCPATTIDLSTIAATNTPVGAVLEWHSAVPATPLNKITNVSALAAGTYYAVFYDSVNGCYSNTSGTTGATMVTATSNVCNTPVSGTIDCSKTQIFTAPIVGMSGQKTLIVNINVTSAGCFTPITVSGSGMSLANNITQVCTATTGVQNFSIPVNYDGTTLGTMNFTVGTAGTCSADLTKTPKKAISDVWTLDCVPTVGPSLK